MKYGFFIILAIVFAVGLILGYGYKVKDCKEAEKLFPKIEELYSVSGTIQDIGSSHFTLAVTFPLNPFEDISKVRKVVVTNSTKIAEQKPKDYATFQQEIEEYQRKYGLQPDKIHNGSQEELPPAPMPFTEKILDFSDLNVGDSVIVNSDKNIKFLEAFEGIVVIRQIFEKIPEPEQVKLNIT